jgi:hypothetical protein
MLDLLILHGSYRRDRAGIRLADYLVRRLADRGHRTELVDAKAVGLPMLDRMYKEHPRGEAPPAGPPSPQNPARRLSTRRLCLSWPTRQPTSATSWSNAAPQPCSKPMSACFFRASASACFTTTV